MTSPGLLEITRKFDRADGHLSQLYDSIKTFLDAHPYRVVPDFDDVGRKAVLRLAIDQAPPALDWAVLLGDALFNLRSGLDHLVWKLGGDPPPHAGTSEFPIFADKTAFRTGKTTDGKTVRSGTTKLQDVPAWPAAIIEDVQPYHRGDQARWHPLQTLGALHNADKHRLLHIVAHGLKSVAYWVDGVDPAALSAVNDRLCFTFGREDGDVLVSWSAQAPPDNYPSLLFEVAFDPDGAGTGRPVLSTLRAVQRFVRRDVLERLVPFL
jgi:hypothetical protein